MLNAMPAPMALTGYARNIVSADPSLAAKIAAEYWNPKQSWHYWEYLGSEMTILKSGTQFTPPLTLSKAVQDRKKLYDEDSATALKVNWL